MGDVNRKVELKTEMVGMKGSELGMGWRRKSV